MFVAWPSLFLGRRDSVMTEKYYRIAGLDVTLLLPADKLYTEEKELSPFSTEKKLGGQLFHFEMVDYPDPPSGKLTAVLPNMRIYETDGGSVRYHGAVKETWENAYARGEHRGDTHHIQLKRARFPQQVRASTVVNCMAIEQMLGLEGGFILHSAYVAWEGRGILFTAPSGTGKSTQAALWERYRGADVVNGDRAAVRIIGDTPMAYGIPFSGTSGISKARELPLTAVVYLSQSKENRLRQLQGYEAFRAIWEGISVNTWDRKAMERVSGTVERLVERIPVYHLACRPDEGAVEILEQALKEKKQW